jgi:hypothetical protein
MADPTLHELVMRNLTKRDIIVALGELRNTINRDSQRTTDSFVQAALAHGYGDILFQAVQQRREERRALREAAIASRGEAGLRSGEEMRAQRFQEMKLGSSVRTHVSHDRFLVLPSQEELKMLYANFYSATSNKALHMSICGVCARSRRDTESSVTSVPLSSLPNRHVLQPKSYVPAEELVDGLLIERQGTTHTEGSELQVAVCEECLKALQVQDRQKPPKYSLANGLWIGRVPWQLQCLTLPEQLLVARLYPKAYIVKLYPKDRRGGRDQTTLHDALRGNITTYEFNTDRIASMIEGRLMPQLPAVLPAVLSVTYVGVGPLPKNWILDTFRVRRNQVGEALRWLKQHNASYYGDIQLDAGRLFTLPLDDVPMEIMATLQQNTAEGVAVQERAGDEVNEDIEHENPVNEIGELCLQYIYISS